MGGKAPKEQTTTQDSSGSTVQRTTIPEFLRPFIEGGAVTAGGALGKLEDLSGGDLVAPFSADQLSAFDLARRFGSSAPFTSALDSLGATARGDFLYGGPGFDQAVTAAVNAAKPHILSTFGAAGRGTGGLAKTAIAQSAIDAFASQYGSERGRQLQAASALPTLGQMPIELLLGTGTLQQQLEQQKRSAPLSAQTNLLTAALAGLPISSLLGFKQETEGTGTSTQPLYQNQTAGALGGALTGAQLGSMFGPIGTGIGAIGGGLLGYFG
jgi:hypothetical protein